MEMRFSRGFYLALVLFFFLVLPAHELGHWIVYRALGIPTRMTFNVVSPLAGYEQHAAGELGGTGMSLLLALLGVAACEGFGRAKTFWAAWALANSFVRLVVYAIIVVAYAGRFLGGETVWRAVAGNDEPTVARLLGWHEMSVVLVFLPLFVLLVWAVLRRFQKGWGRKAWLVVALLFLYLGLGIFVNQVLDPLVFGVH
jgi:hypothetical protein